MATLKKDKKIKIGTKSKSSGWTLDSPKFRILSEERLSDLNLRDNLHNVSLGNINSTTPSNPPKDSIILSIAVIFASIPIPFPREVCQIIKSTNSSLGKLSPNAFRILVGMLTLFKLFGHRVPTPDRFCMLYQIKDNHSSVGLYSLSSWDSGNLVIGNLESEKNWKEELVVVSRKWYSNEALPEDIPPTSFEMAKGWKKSTLENYDKVLIQELIFMANLPIRHRH